VNEAFSALRAAETRKGKPARMSPILAVDLAIALISLFCMALGLRAFSALSLRMTVTSSGV